jgi:Cd2+/Zn2+-exporting ATPase
MINNDGLIKAKTVKSFSQSTSSRILQLVEQARKQKSKSETFISSFAKVYTPIVVFSAIALTAIPVLLLGKPLDTWIYRSLVFLVVSCPCALVISVPLTFFAGIGALAKKGILVKGSSFMDKLAKVTYVAFDKTGTITKGSFSLIGIYTAKNTSREDLLWLTALSESKSNHPIARSIIGEWEANQQTIRKDRHYSLTTDLEAQRHLSGTKEFAGMGLEAKIDGRLIQVGNEKFMKQLQVALPYDEIAPMASVATLIHVAAEGTYLGTVGIGDILRKDTDQVIQALKRLGIRRTYLLSGDSQANTDKVAAEVGINEAKAQLLPQGKVAEVVKIKQQGGTVAFIGDGMNDAPVIATADVGIAMGALGSDAAIEASDMVVMGEDLATLPQAIRISRKTVRIARQNIVFALTVKIAILILGAFGLATMWMAVFADVGVSMLAILNAMRMLRNRQ